MTYGKFLVINLDSGSPGILCENHGDDIWPSTKIFDYNTWTNQDTMEQIVKNDEKKDLMGNHCFERNENFALGIWCKDEAKANDLLKVLPHQESFLKINIV